MIALDWYWFTSPRLTLLESIFSFMFSLHCDQLSKLGNGQWASGIPMAISDSSRSFFPYRTGQYHLHFILYILTKRALISTSSPPSSTTLPHCQFSNTPIQTQAVTAIDPLEAPFYDCSLLTLNVHSAHLYIHTPMSIWTIVHDLIQDFRTCLPFRFLRPETH